MTTISIPELPVPAASVENHIVAAEIERVRQYAEAAHSVATRRTYAAGFRSFAQWCVRRGFDALPATPQTVSLYVADIASSAKFATIRKHLAAIAFRHRETGLESPVAHEVVRRVVRGIARTNGTAQVRKSAVSVNDVRAMLLEIRGTELKATRDRACILLGFAAALRRSELAALTVDDVTFCKEGLRLRIQRSKTDQTGAGAEIAVPYVKQRSLCAVRAVREWLGLSGVTAGPLFRTFSLQGNLSERSMDGRDVANLVKLLTGRAHLVGDFSGHSLRAGFVTSCAQAKVSLDAIARTTRHKSLAVLMTYVRPAQAFDDVALSAMIA